MPLKSNSYGWIEAAIRYTGRFGPREKMAYQDIFQLSAPTASRHQEHVATALETQIESPLFERNSNGKIKGGKLTLLPHAELPKEKLFERVPNVERWLQDTFDGVYFYAVEVIRAEPKPEIIRPIINALTDKQTLRIEYHSKKGISTRTISPQIVIKVAARMHLRAFDHGKNGYRDFVFTRISKVQSIENDEPAFIGPEHDHDWRTYIEIKIKEKSHLGKSETEGIRMEFGLEKNGEKTMSVREPLAQYITDVEDEHFASPVNISLK